MGRELKVLHVETSGAARELLDAMHALTSSEGWALFEQLVEVAYSDQAFAGQATAIISTGDAIERRMAELVGQRKAANYIMGLPRMLKHQCQAMLSEEERDGVEAQG
jgi:hypothetical protein